MEVNFKFKPLQYIKIITFDLNYPGRVLVNEYNGHKKQYVVEYAVDGRLERRSFYEDENEAV